MAWAALLESPSVPAAIGLPVCAPELKFCAKPSGERALVGAEVEGVKPEVAPTDEGAEAPVPGPMEDRFGLPATADGPPPTPRSCEVDPGRGVVSDVPKVFAS